MEVEQSISNQRTPRNQVSRQPNAKRTKTTRLTRSTHQTRSISDRMAKQQKPKTENRAVSAFTDGDVSVVPSTVSESRETQVPEDSQNLLFDDIIKKQPKVILQRIIPEKRVEKKKKTLAKNSHCTNENTNSIVEMDEIDIAMVDESSIENSHRTHENTDSIVDIDIAMAELHGETSEIPEFAFVDCGATCIKNELDAEEIAFGTPHSSHVGTDTVVKNEAISNETSQKTNSSPNLSDVQLSATRNGCSSGNNQHERGGSVGTAGTVEEVNQVELGFIGVDNSTTIPTSSTYRETTTIMTSTTTTVVDEVEEGEIHDDGEQEEEGGEKCTIENAANITDVTYQGQPDFDTDIVMANTVNTNYCCMTAVEEYEGKSLEELRLEYYLANRMGPRAGSIQGGCLFGTSQPNTNIFGAPASQTQSTGLLGASWRTNTLSGFGAFEQAAPAFGTPNHTINLYNKPANTSILKQSILNQPASNSFEVQLRNSTGLIGFGNVKYFLLQISYFCLYT